MIEFKSVEVQNFLSVGNIPISIPLNSHHITTITGSSGSGKSLIVTDALVFGIFGRPFRNINKPQLVNSINKKNCKVIVEFSVSGSEYKVVRGVKPNIFEIYKDQILINQDAHSKDYQAVLEQQILKLNYKTFTQVVILGSASYIPFMQLPALQRREVVENILDISVFTTMSQILKERFSVAKDVLNQYDNNLLIVKNKIESQKKLVDILVDSKQSRIDSLLVKLEENRADIERNQDSLSSIQESISQLQQGLDLELSNAISINKTNQIKLGSKIEGNVKQLKFFQKNNSCPSCCQQISDDHKHEVEDQLQQENLTLTNELNLLNEQLLLLKDKLLINEEINNKIRDLNIKQVSIQQSIKMLKNDNKGIQIDIDNIKNDKANINDEKSLMKTLAKEAIKLVEDKSVVMDQIQLYTAALQLLKDDGIKTAIIKEYLPTINKLINHYLSILDLYVRFELDTSLNETVKSRGRDLFSYNSFSEGEKSRLSIALMLTWRSIAKSKGAVYTNLLILDEIFSQHLDPIGIQAVKDLLVNDLQNNNIFCITHTHVDEFKAISDSVIEVKKVGDFSAISLE